MNLSSSTKTTLASGATAVGTTNVNGTTLDMSCFDGVMLILIAGTVTDGNLAVKAAGGAVSDGSDKSDLLGTSTVITNAQDNDVAILDLYRPLQRFITPVIVRGGATGAVVQALVAIQYSAANKPTVQDATTIALTKLVVSPAVGTA